MKTYGKMLVAIEDAGFPMRRLMKGQEVFIEPATNLKDYDWFVTPVEPLGTQADGRWTYNSFPVTDDEVQITRQEV